MTKPLWENEQFKIYDDRLQTIIFSLSYEREALKKYPVAAYNHCASSKFNKDQLYEAFLQLATYWDLQCDFDELRKIRDQAKEPAQ